jgi:short-subunit dehydrogenase
MDNWALITGASAGIGRELAGLFAADHFNLVLLGRNRTRLEQLAADLQTRHQIQTLTLPIDLAEPGASERIFSACQGKTVSVLVNNAGFGWRGLFVDGDLKLALDMMHVNMDALVELTHRFVQPMRARRTGRILNVASTAAFQPGPLSNIYYATKAFVFSFSVALGEELAPTGITVTAFCPGATQTEFHARAGMQRSTHKLQMMPVETVARIGYRGCMRGKPIVIPGLLNQVMAAIARRLPPRFTAKIVRRINQG